jgi:hypothetical protein
MSQMKAQAEVITAPVHIADVAEQWLSRGQAQLQLASLTAPCLSVIGSVSVIAFVTRVTSTSGPMLPSEAASLAGRHIRSSCSHKHNDT